MDNDDVISTLNDLIETCKDGEYGFRSCAEHVDSRELATLFSQRADECRQAAVELQEHVLQLGGKPDTGGSLSGAVHRGWVAVRSALSVYDNLSVLKECERGEDIAVTSYRDALEQPLPEPVRSVVERQYLGAKRNHDQVRVLRDSLEVVK
ncbi:MAG: PA2169 family four-helix-bundle protein [Bacteroidota bacterium]